VDPDEVGMSAAALAAVLTETLGPGFTTNLIVCGELLNEEITEDGFGDMADESVRTLRDSAREVVVAARTNTGTRRWRAADMAARRNILA
jgi:hypothetical protein